MRTTGRAVFLAGAAALIVTGCSYYNTFYNIRKDFRVAERQTELSSRQQQGAQAAQPPRTGQQPPRSSGSAASATGYQGVIESCSKLLEFYPKSRWVDDALMIMGVSYFRMQEYSRSERKFSELVTIFPKSKHVVEAKVWRARALIEQGKYDDAEKILTVTEGEIRDPDHSALAFRTLAEIQSHRGAKDQAVSHYEKCVALSYGRDERATDYLSLGRLRYELGKYEESRRALESCLRLTRDTGEAYAANLLLANAERDAGDYQSARATLSGMLQRSAFLSHEQELRLELAITEAQSENSDQAVVMLQDYIDHAPVSESKGRAYYLQALIERDRRREFESAKAKFDSVGPAGASRSLTDSARSAAEELGAVIETLAGLPHQMDSVVTLTEQVATTRRQAADEAARLEEGAADDSIATDTLSQTPVAPDSLPSEVVEFVDTLRTPAELAADSILRSLAILDSLSRAAIPGTDSTQVAGDSSEAAFEKADSVVEESIAARLERQEAMLSGVESRVIAACLDLASYYSIVLADPDSSEYFLRRAVERPSVYEDFFRAKVQLALGLSQDGELTEESKRLLSEVAEDESASRDLRNRALGALDRPFIELQLSDQEEAFQLAERAYLGGAPHDSVIQLYNLVVEMDSVSVAGYRSLLAVAFLSEYVVRDYEMARAVNESLVNLFPDSVSASVWKTKLQPPDSASVFSLTDEQLQAATQPVLESLSAPSDSSGWPPPEETLKGRRFQ